MNSDWLAASNFERMHELTSAINTLSIHAKLGLAHVPDPTPDIEVNKARDRLRDFLVRLRGVIDELMQDGNRTIVGADPRLGELALQLHGSGARRGRQRSMTDLPLTALSDLIQSERSEDLERLIPYLQELRALIEEQAHPDVVGILGDM